MKAISPSSCYPLLWWFAVLISVVSSYRRALPALQASAWHITHLRHCSWKQHLWGLLLVLKGELDRALCTCLVCAILLWTLPETWQFSVLPFSSFPGLVFHDTLYSLLRNSHVFPKAPHLGSDAQLLPGPCCVPAVVCVYHPWESTAMSMSLRAGGQLCPTCTPATACLCRLRCTVGAPDRLSFHAQCSLLPLMHLGWKRILVVIPAAVSVKRTAASMEQLHLIKGFRLGKSHT